MNKKLFMVFIVIVASFLITGCGNKTYGLNDTATSKNDNLKITILGVEDASINEGELSIANGEYTKVKLSIENIGTEDFTWTSINFLLGDKVEAIGTISQSDYLPARVAAGKTITGYIYYEKTDSRDFEFKSYNLKDGKQETILFTLK